MMVLLVLKENLKSLYGRFAVVADALIKFCLSLVIMLLLNSNIGFMAELNHMLAAVLIALVCAFLPYGAISFLLAAVMLCHIYAISFEIALVTGVFLILVALLSVSYTHLTLPTKRIV